MPAKRPHAERDVTKSVTPVISSDDRLKRPSRPATQKRKPHGAAVKLSSDVLEARVEAYLEASGHLLQTWTDSPLEREAGVWLSNRLQRMAEKLDAERVRRRKQEHAAAHPCQ
jgi:hypothetical protein